MARVTNVMKKIKNAEVNTYYDLCLDNINEIIDNSPGAISAVCNGFLFGYLQGIKAEKSKSKNICKTII
ncbi:MAG TPA: hypothetical protein DC000_03500 [Clostridiales bacterium]|nr:hypothetical protein [Clostridiales bacterium]